MIELLRTDDPVFISWLTARLAEEGIEVVVFDSHTSNIYGGALDTLTRRVMVAEENGVADRVSFRAADIALGGTGLPRGTFGHAMVNPPYLVAGAGRPSADGRKAAATVENGADLGSWIEFCVSMVRDRGSVTVVHRADRLDALLAVFAGRAGGIVVFPLWPSEGSDAKRVVVTARKGSATPTRVARGLVLHAADGAYTDEAEAVLRHGAALDI